MEAWGIAKTRKNPKLGEAKYYGNTEEKKKAYSEGYLSLHPGTPDPIIADLDERVVVGMGPKRHGRSAVLDAVINPSISFTQLRATDPSLSQRTSTPMTSAQSHSLFAERQSAYMEYQRRETLAWHTSLLAHQHVAWSNNMHHVVESITAGRVPQLQPAPEPPQLVLLTFEEFLAQHPGPSPGTSASTVGGGAGLGTTPESRSPITPIHRGGGGGGLAGSAAANSDDLGGLGRPGP